MKLRDKMTGGVMTNYECGRALVYIAEQIIKTFGKDFGLEVQEPKQEPKEPLIKDAKVRKAVRAWANSFDDVDEIKASDDYKEFWIDGYLIEFERSFDEVESEHTYRRTNIIELCGEEE